MKKNFIIYTFIIFILTSFSIFAEREVDIDKIKYDKKNELGYVEGEKEPFTGIAKDYYEDKSLKVEFPYKNGRIEGKAKAYYPSGKFKSEAFFVDDLLQGKSVGYYESGNLQYEDNYKDGELDGESFNFNEDGSLRSKAVYKNGELVDTKEYKINTYEEKPISVTNNSDTNVDNDLELKNKNFFEKNRSFILYSLGFLLVMAIIIFFTVIGIKEKLDNKNVSYDYEDTEDKKILYCNDKPVNRKIRYIYLPDSEFTSISLEITYKHGVPIFIKLHHYDPYVSQENTNFEILIKKISKNFEGSFTILYDEHKIIANGKFKLPPRIIML